MSIQDMIKDIEKDAWDDIATAKDHAKAESTKSLLAKADQWEAFYQNKKDKLRIQLERNEISLKAEKDFNIRMNNIVSEDKFAENLLPFIRYAVLSFIEKDFKSYISILDQWIEKSIEMLDGDLIIKINPRDITALDSYQGKISSVVEDNSLAAGIIISSNLGMHIDLSFEKLYTDKKQHLQNLVMKELKENIQ
ncbi:MAG: hypothetical protein ACRC9L_05695 [Brevinema sp.]